MNKVNRGVTLEGHQSGINGQKSIQAFPHDDFTAFPVCTTRLKSSDIRNKSEKSEEEGADGTTSEPCV